MICFLIPALAWAESEQETAAPSTTLRQNYHRLETGYAVSRIRPADETDKTTLQNFLISGDVVLTPEASLTATLPIVALARQVGLANPSLGFKSVFFEGLLKGFPTFVFFSGNVKFPLSSDQEFVFQRTDVAIQVSSLREVYHLSLRSDLAYILKFDSSSADEKYGNELTTTVGGELNTGYHFSVGLDLNYRYAGGFRSEQERISGRSLFILRPHFAYSFKPDMLLHGIYAMPVGRAQLRETLRVFGDYTIPGVAGDTFLLSFEKRF